ncbi:uroporphyrinogen-III synthase / uroporphyrinogen-III C-methyltransferase [Calothrix parasitica NIES-267]|uniref:uroporphyrinogen-III C-methyltransferase n=1 Tax=Calothrix parasitica NIES-267 TaxID=1973488 RepID=A0A1Z4LZ81_9CYAN|nr:uroporphyrinogen-III synthase / uroporphyrinogen-III C-methyltransferase [Calothrix parasitica NIES-267]
MTKSKGKVYLVGAGPGEVDYLTVKAYKLLSTAEVLIYDALVDEELLKLVPHNCLKIHVGKRGGLPSTPQSEINGLLVKYCQQEKQVIRLKSGDPFIFGRCILEIQALKNAGCDFEVVPGISSVTSAPLLAGIPLTDAVMSKCFAVSSAHQPDILDWEALSRLDTLVLLMGGKHLREIVDQLIKYGKNKSTPVAIIRKAGTSEQQVWIAELSTIVEHVKTVRLSPAVIVIGKIVSYGSFSEKM